METTEKNDTIILDSLDEDCTIKENPYSTEDQSDLPEEPDEDDF